MRIKKGNIELNSELLSLLEIKDLKYECAKIDGSLGEAYEINMPTIMVSKDKKISFFVALFYPSSYCKCDVLYSYRKSKKGYEINVGPCEVPKFDRKNLRKTMKN